MTQKNRLILIISICVLAVIVATTTILVLVFNNDNNKWQDVGGLEYTPPPDQPYEPTITYDIVVNRGLESEYYINQEFDINEVYIYYRKLVDGRVEWAENVRCAPAFIKGYPETPIPDTDTLGVQSFTLTYLGLDCDVSFNVVEYNERHMLKFINDKTYMENDSLFGVIGRYVENGVAADYAQGIRTVVADSQIGLGPLVFMSIIENFIEIKSQEGETDNGGLWGNPNNPNEQAQLVKDVNLYTGTMWVIAELATYKLEFEMQYYPTTKGLRLEMSANGVNYGIYISSTEKTYNMVISGAMAEDVIMTYGADTIYLSTCDAGLYSIIYNNVYDETFGSVGNDVLELDVDTGNYVKR